jgi:esterase FrsA
VIQKDKLAVMGLSRGVFIACHVAAAIPAVSTILGFAPLTNLCAIKEFSDPLPWQIHWI